MTRLGCRGFPLGLTAIWALVAASGASAQEDFLVRAPLEFERIPDDAGLSHNSVHVIRQDAAGFLWVGTADGLNRFDGYEFKVFRPEAGDSASISSRLIWDLLEDDRGLWILGDRGVDRFDPETGRFLRYPSFRSSEGGAMFRGMLGLGADRRVWALTQGGLQFLGDDDRFHEADEALLGLAPGAPLPVALVPSPEGALWALMTGGDLVQLPGGQRVGTASERFVDLFTAVDGSGESLVSPPRGRSASVEDAPSFPFYTAVRFGATVWVATPDGLRELGPMGGLGPIIPVVPGAADFVFNFLRALHVDRAGTLWAGTHGGLFRDDPNTKPFHTLGSAPESASAPAVASILVREGVALVGSYGNGLEWIDLGDGSTSTLRHDPDDRRSLPSDVVWSLARDSTGRSWVGTDAGLARMDPVARDFAPVGGPATGPVKHIAVDADGDLWLAARLGLFRYRPDDAAMEGFPCCGSGMGPSHQVVESVTADETGVWIGSGNASLDRWDRTTGRFTSVRLVDDSGGELGGLALWDLHVDPDGRVWVGTGAGLASYDPESGAMSVVGTSQGLPGNVVFSIEADRHGRLWLGTNQGLARYHPDSPADQRIRTYGLVDGISGLEFNRHASFADAAGRLWFGTIGGVTWFDPGDVRDNPIAPSTVITSVRSSGPEGSSDHVPADEPLRLAFDENTVEFEFAALSFTNPEQNRYRYRLDPIESDWVESSRRSARYAGLPPGRYTFSALGSNNDGVWSEDSATFGFDIVPPWWQSWWFRSLLLLSLVVGGASAYQYRVRQLLAMERLRLRIAGDLHDDLASELSGMALLAESLEDRLPPETEIRAQWARLTSTAQRLARDVRDIVWTVDPGHAGLEDLVHRMREVASGLLTRVPHAFVVAGVADGEITLTLEQRRQLLLVLKEALHNVVRHAEAESVEIRVERDRGHLVLTVTDTGLGFDPDRPGRSFGLDQMRRRGRQLGGQTVIDSGPGRGTSVRLQVPLR